MVTSAQVTQDSPQPAQEQQNGTPSTLFNKYGYDEFIGFDGYNRLDRITQLVLTAANARTWRSADKFVAPGNDCYVGIYRLSDNIRPGVRKVEMDFKSLRDLDLVDIYPDYRLVKRADTGQVEMTACIVKDFRKLYTLAHEYYLWEISPEYIPPEWKYKELILANEALTAKLRRFDNYRRILECHKPGRKPVLAEPPMSHADLLAIAAEDAQETISGTDPKEFSNTPNKTLSPNRNTRILQRELNQDGSSRSGSAAELGGKGVAVAAIGNEYTASTTGTNGGNQRTVQTSNTKPPTVLETRATPEHVKDAETPKYRRKKHEAGERPPQPLPQYLRDTILKPISVFFCDQSPASSETSMAWLYAEFYARGFDEYGQPFLDLINGSRDITNTRMERGLIDGRNPDGSVAQMKYFFGILEPAVYRWCKRYDEVLEDLRSESAQAQEVVAQGKGSEERDENSESAEVQEPTLPPANAEELEASPSQEDQPPASTLLEQETELSSNGTETTLNSPPLTNSLDEQQPAPQGNDEEWWPVSVPDGASVQYPNREIVGFIDTDNPDEGWRHGAAALRAGQLHFYLGREHYQYAILPTHCHGHYGIVIVERQTGREKVYVRDWEIEQSMQQHLRL
jgi:hypothetical protein